jgi:hypothetical protein
LNRKRGENPVSTVEKSFHIPKWGTQVINFIWHLAQMIAVMEAGMIVYMRLIRPLLAPTAFSTLTTRYPLFSYWMMVVSMALPMVALMRLYHRSSWSYSLRMTFVMVMPIAALTVMVLCTLIPIHTMYAIGDPLMYLTMAAYMLVRPHEHAHSGHQSACHMA